MKTNIMTVAFVATIALIAGINVFNAQKTVTLSDIAMENVEALAQGETSQTCTRAVAWANCYNKESNMWVGLIIKQVEPYVVDGIMQECKHDKVSKCPDGTYER